MSLPAGGPEPAHPEQEIRACSTQIVRGRATSDVPAYGATGKFPNNSKVVPETRLELVSPLGRRILSPLRIPFRHSGKYYDLR